jgi:hypothetical protein
MWPQALWAATAEIFRAYLRDRGLDFRRAAPWHQFLEYADGAPDLSRRGFSEETLDALENVLTLTGSTVYSLVRLPLIRVAAAAWNWSAARENSCHCIQCTLSHLTNAWPSARRWRCA